MPRIKIDNLIIFGDSMSDIGNKAATRMGAFADFFGLMQVNDLGRFSDGKNWTDFFWEWAGGMSMFRPAKFESQDPEYLAEKLAKEPKAKPSTPKDESTAATEVHRTLTVNSNQDSGFGRPITYVNYAEGGAMGASDRSKIGLGTFRQQYEGFRAQHRSCPLVGTTMYIIWFGLNDLVTNKRDPETMNKVVEQTFEIIRELRTISGDHAHFMLINLPDPADAVRYAELGREDALMVRFTSGARVFNAELAAAVAHSPSRNIRLVDMYTVLKKITASPASLATNRLTLGAQPGVVPIDYPHVGPLPN
ncbi:hypothetical protein D7V97_32205, partial [Corallococcus sp. CA053C]|uniref:SGNH/GDSL hydrolase family protein n=1 Tax=Corallococcus sp. CA053C TaxID=2316732 RepID=UPI000ECD70FD